MTVSENDVKMGELVTKQLDWVKPYWRNPRRVPEEAVNALADSIRRYGYQQPVVVDEEGVIIIGHTRYSALRKLDVREAPILVVSHLSAKKVKELRVIDNRVAEYTSWDLDALTVELEGFDQDLLQAYFPEMATLRDGGEDFVEFDNTMAQEAASAWDNVDDKVDFVCPSCFHSFVTKVTRDAVLTGRIEAVK